MPLIKSISGIRGTIGGRHEDSLSPGNIVKFTAAFGYWIKNRYGKSKIVIGRDARISGPVVRDLVSGTLRSLGIDVVDLGLSTTPTVEMAVVAEEAGGGIIITASHNPKNWNALKLLNENGEFISASDGAEVLDLADSEDFEFAGVEKLGQYIQNDSYIEYHINKILALPMVDIEAIKAREFKVVIDCVNSTGAISIPPLLEALGVKEVKQLYCEPNGKFPHNPEPLPENLSAISNEVRQSQADVGLVVDPDVDRLALVCEDGSMFGEEYTLVSIADYILSSEKGPTVSNLSSTRALRDVSEAAGVKYHASAVGEVNVVAKMKEVGAVIGGEGNGGVIYPALHYGRDALVGIALFLSHLARSGNTCSMLKSSYPSYFIAKHKIELAPGLDVKAIFKAISEKYKQHPISTIDGLKIELDTNWVHLRTSNTEPIIRIYAESQSETTANHIAHKLMGDIREFNQES